MFTSNSEKQKLIVHIFLFLALQILLLVVIVGASKYVPLSEKSKEHYLFRVRDNIEQLQSIKGKRIILFGGSSIGFSVDSKALQEDLGIPVVNLGIHAALEFEKIFDIYFQYLNPKLDTIVLSPEYEIIDKTRGYRSEMASYIFLDRRQDLLASPGFVKYFIEYPSLMAQDFFYLVFNSKNFDKVYYRSAFNKNGDVVSHLGKENKSRLKTVVPPIEAREYLNIVKKTFLDKGYKVIYIPTIVPQESCANSENQYRKIQNEIVSALDDVSS